jgi:hypothetical protein
VKIPIVKPAKLMALIYNLSIINSLNVKLAFQASSLTVVITAKLAPILIVWNATMPKMKEKPAQCVKTLNLSLKKVVLLPCAQNPPV